VIKIFFEHTSIRQLSRVDVVLYRPPRLERGGALSEAGSKEGHVQLNLSANICHASLRASPRSGQGVYYYYTQTQVTAVPNGLAVGVLLYKAFLFPPHILVAKDTHT